VPDKVKVTFEPKAEANLRKLARALIALAERSLDEEDRSDDVPSKEAS
jgi:hypothetical protein